MLCVHFCVLCVDVCCVYMYVGYVVCAILHVCMLCVHVCMLCVHVCYCCFNRFSLDYHRSILLNRLFIYISVSVLPAGWQIFLILISGDLISGEYILYT